MNVSARNVFHGRVTALSTGMPGAEVVVELPGGDRLVAVAMVECVRELGLAEGREVIALVKAPWVTVLAGTARGALSARNLLEGRVCRIEAGAVNVEIGIKLAGGSVVTATVTREARAELGLAPGAAATAVIDASHVVLGIAPDQ